MVTSGRGLVDAGADGARAAADDRFAQFAGEPDVAQLAARPRGDDFERVGAGPTEASRGSRSRSAATWRTNRLTALRE